MNIEIAYIPRDELSPGYPPDFKHTPGNKLTGNQAARYERLKADLLKNGMKYPLMVFDDGKYNILIGNQRFECLRETTALFPCVVVDGWKKQGSIVAYANAIAKQIDMGLFHLVKEDSPLNPQDGIDHTYSYIPKAAPPLWANMNVKALHLLAKEKGIKGHNKMNKKALIAAIVALSK